MTRALLVLLILAAVATPASGATVLIPNLVGQAIALEKKGLEHATPVATRGLAERFNTLENLENLVTDYEYVSTPDHHDLVICSSSCDEVRVRITPGEIRVEYSTPRGPVRHSLSLNPEHTYLVLAPQGLHTIPVMPQQGGGELPILIIRGGRAYEPTPYFPSFILGDYAESVTPLTRAVGLMGFWDLLVRLRIEGETVAFDLVRSDGSGAYRVVCDLRTGSAWREPLPPEEARRLLDLAREDLAKLPKLKSGELESESGLRLIVYDATEGRVLLELAEPSLELLRERNPRLVELVEFLRELRSEPWELVIRWDVFRLSARARELHDLLETTGLADTRLIRLLLRPDLVLGTYLLTIGLGLATSVAWIELLEHLPRLGKAPEFRWDPPTLLEYAKRLAYAGAVCGLEVVCWCLLNSSTKILLEALGLRDYALDGRLVDLVGGSVWAPLIEEPTKRLLGELSGLPRPLAGAWYGLLEAVGKGEIRPGEVKVWNVIVRVSEHLCYTLSPLPLGALLHSLTSLSIDVSPELTGLTQHWVAVLGATIAVLGALAENALTGVW